MHNIDVQLRPTTLDSLYQSPAKDIVTNKANYKHLGHSFLLVGPSGNGKTTTGRALASYLFTNMTSEEYDLTNTECYKEINGSDYTGVDDMRALVREVQPPPLMDDITVVVIDEAHYLSKNAQSAMLKCLEEPPEHLYLIIITDQPEKLQTPVKNRCELINLPKPNELKLLSYGREYVIPRIVKLLESEQNQANWRANLETLDDKQLRYIIAVTDLSYRSVVKSIHSYLLTGKVMSMSQEDETSLGQLAGMILNPSPGWRPPLVSAIRGVNDPESLRIALCNYIGAIYLNKLTSIQWNEDTKHGEDHKYMRTISMLKEPLSMASQKADIVVRLSQIILKNAGLLQ